MKIFFFFLATLFLTQTSCSKPTKSFDLTKEERAWMTKFFRQCMLRDPGIYTLLGSKPMTQIIFTYPKKRCRDRTKEEIKKCRYLLLNRDDEKDCQFYATLSPKEKEKTYMTAEENFIHSTGELWDKWEKVQHRFPLNERFILVKKERDLSKAPPYFARKYTAMTDVYFVDVMKTAFVIQENYSLFKRLLGFDFDPLTVVFELESESSHFWNELMGNHDRGKYTVLWGILFGFGRVNAYLQGWWLPTKRGKKGSGRAQALAKSLPTWSGARKRVGFSEDAFTLSNFETPSFVSFSENDPVVEKYEKEQKKIQAMYRGKDFLDFTLELLTENSSTLINQ